MGSFLDELISDRRFLFNGFLTPITFLLVADDRSGLLPEVGKKFGLLTHKEELELNAKDGYFLKIVGI